VIREMGSGFKTNAVYGGRSGSKDKIELKHPPAILIGTPGRILDHIRNKNIATKSIKSLVLDEFDKSMEVGFKADLKEIMQHLPSVRKKILTSATKKVSIPPFINLRKPKELNFRKEAVNELAIKIIVSPTENKLRTLETLLNQIGEGSGIIFCNVKESIQIIHDFLVRKNLNHACFYGGMEQFDRERALVKFRNGSHRLLLATDLAARGLDIPELDYIIHYQLPPKHDEFIHRNGRTARMHSNGTAYVLKWENEELPEFIKDAVIEKVKTDTKPISNNWETIYISGGRKDKISKGDVAGLFMKQGGLKKDELGLIELTQNCVYVAVPRSKSKDIIDKLNNAKLKTKRVRISLLK
jgi:superfamily II DNA/RNA helicase